MFSTASEIAKQMESLAREASLLAPYMAEFDAIGQFAEDNDATLYLTSGPCLSIYVTGKPEKLTAFWAYFRSRGYIPDAHVPEGKFSSFSTRFRKDPEKYEGNIYFSYSSTVCRRVQVGTKTVEEPVYEIQCDNGETDNVEAG